MKSIECLSLAKHVSQMLTESPLGDIRGAHAEFEQVTAELGKARLARERASAALSLASARVRDATPSMAEQCKRARALLVVEGVPLAPHAADTGETPRSLLARAEVLLEHGTATGVKLPALVAQRDRFHDAVAARAAARASKHEAAVALRAAVERWTDASVALRRSVEGVLRRQGLKKADLKQRLESYFPKRGRRSAAEPSQPQAPGAPGPEAKPGT